MSVLVVAAWAGYSYMNNSWARVTVGHYQAVGDVMQLAAQPAPQVQPAHQLARLAAVPGVLQLLQAALQLTFQSSTLCICPRASDYISCLLTVK